MFSSLSSPSRAAKGSKAGKASDCGSGYPWKVAIVCEDQSLALFDLEDESNDGAEGNGTDTAEGGKCLVRVDLRTLQLGRLRDLHSSFINTLAVENECVRKVLHEGVSGTGLGLESSSSSSSMRSSVGSSSSSKKKHQDKDRTRSNSSELDAFKNNAGKMNLAYQNAIAKRAPIIAKFFRMPRGSGLSSLG